MPLLLLAIVMALALAFGVSVVITDWPKREFVPPQLLDGAPGDFTALTINVGNAALACRGYEWKLCKAAVERELTENLQRLRPEIVALQEVHPEWLCGQRPTTNPDHVCGASLEGSPQARRLLGEEYTIVCDGRGEFECIGVRTDFGTIEGCEPGGLCTSDRIDEQLAGCDPTFAVLSVRVETDELTFTLVNAHPQARDDRCRTHSMRQIFEAVGGAPPLAGSGEMLLLGDLNMDPWRFDDESVAVWSRYVGEGSGKPYTYLSGPAAVMPPYPTWYLGFLRYTLDHVISNTFKGQCVVLGISAGTLRIDSLGGGLDHRALYCSLVFPEVGPVSEAE